MRIPKMEIKTATLGDFDDQTTDFISELIMERFSGEGIKVKGFSFAIEVDYTEDTGKENDN